MSYKQYRDLIERLANTGSTTGGEQTESRIDFTRLNRQRMARLDKTTTLIEPVEATSRANFRPMTWLILTEAWCGDAAQNIPVIEKIAAVNSNIETRYILRDENLELMDRHLENGSRSIPKLIALDTRTLEVLGTWGSRPKELKNYFLELKAQGLDKAEIGELLQRWYNHDRGRSLQNEFTGLIRKWAGAETALAAV